MRRSREPVIDDDDVDDRCAGCSRDIHTIGENFMIRDELWDAITPETHRHVVLCVGCIETLLRRPLTPQDFTPVPLNGIAAYCGSDRLRDRMTHGDERIAQALMAAADEYLTRTIRPTSTKEEP